MTVLAVFNCLLYTVNVDVLVVDFHFKSLTNQPTLTVHRFFEMLTTIHNWHFQTYSVVYWLHNAALVGLLKQLFILRVRF